MLASWWRLDDATVELGQLYSGLPPIQPPFGTSQSVLIRGVASFQGWICNYTVDSSNPATLGTSFQG